jgi:hypothetical protein
MSHEAWQAAHQVVVEKSKRVVCGHNEIVGESNVPVVVSGSSQIAGQEVERVCIASCQSAKCQDGMNALEHVCCMSSTVVGVVQIPLLQCAQIPTSILTLVVGITARHLYD